jgi:hypothetical protein
MCHYINRTSKTALFNRKHIFRVQICIHSLNECPISHGYLPKLLSVLVFIYSRACVCVFCKIGVWVMNSTPSLVGICVTVPETKRAWKRRNCHSMCEFLLREVCKCPLPSMLILFFDLNVVPVHGTMYIKPDWLGKITETSYTSCLAAKVSIW